MVKYVLCGEFVIIFKVFTGLAPCAEDVCMQVWPKILLFSLKVLKCLLYITVLVQIFVGCYFAIAKI